MRESGMSSFPATYRRDSRGRYLWGWCSCTASRMLSNAPGRPLFLAMAWSMKTCSALSGRVANADMCLGAPFARDQHRGTVRGSDKRPQAWAAVRNERMRSCYLRGSSNSAGNSVRRVTSGGDIAYPRRNSERVSNLEQMLHVIKTTDLVANFQVGT